MRGWTLLVLSVYFICFTFKNSVTYSPFFTITRDFLPFLYSTRDTNRSNDSSLKGPVFYSCALRPSCMRDTTPFFRLSGFSWLTISDVLFYGLSSLDVSLLKPLDVFYGKLISHLMSSHIRIFL